MKGKKQFWVIGVTGIIGSGKSTFSRFLGELGAYVIDTDQVARELMEKSETVRQKIVQTFGTESYTPEGKLNRAKIAAVVFQNPEALRRLNAIVHPEVIQAVHEKIRQLVRGNFQGILVIDAPLIFETGLSSIMDATVVVAASEKTCIRRVRTRSGLSEEEVRARLKNQWPLEEKIQRADVVVWNEGTPEELKKQAVALFEKFQKQREALEK